MILIFFGLFIILLYLYSVRNFDYWKKRGVKHDKPLPFFGTSAKQLLQRISISEMIRKHYNKYPNERVVGSFLGNRPVLILRDPALIKQVMMTDFHVFHARGASPHKEEFDPMLKNLFSVDGDTWKLVRQRITPAFTTGKLKAMFPLIEERATKLLGLAATAAESNTEVDVRELLARYTTDFIGACGFGIETDSLSNESSVFRKLGKRIFTITLRDALVMGIKTLKPETFKRLNWFAPEVIRDATYLVRTIMQQRNYNVSGRNDFIDLLLEQKKKGKIVGESLEKRNDDGTPCKVELELDDLLMAAQVFVFFAAGFETSSSSSSYLLYELAFNPDVQKKCQNEIDAVLSKYDGRLTYDAVKEMKYLNMAFSESLRMLPPLGYLTRRCTKKYTFPGTNITIDEDVMINISVQGLHRDAQYFEDPDQFKPERFDPANANNIPKYAYLPFGEGPRSCIGERLGLMQSLAGVAAILSQFSVAPSKSTARPLVLNTITGVVQDIKGGIPLALIKRKKD